MTAPRHQTQTPAHAAPPAAGGFLARVDGLASELEQVILDGAKRLTVPRRHALEDAHTQLLLAKRYLERAGEQPRRRRPASKRRH